VIVLNKSHLNLNYFSLESSREIFAAPERGKLKQTNSFRMDYLDIDIKSWQAKSITEDLIQLISDHYQEFPQRGTQEGLRNFYARAKSALDAGFAEAEENFSGDKVLFDSAYNQAVKELKDWYHNGGEPREKVNLTSVQITEVNLEFTNTVKKSLEADLKE